MHIEKWKKDIRKKKLSTVITCHGYVLRLGERPLLCVVRFHCSYYSASDILRGTAWEECNSWSRLPPMGLACYSLPKRSPFGTEKYQTDRDSKRDRYIAERYFEDGKSCIEVLYEHKWKLAIVLAIKRFICLEWLSLYFCVEKRNKVSGSELS